MPYNPNLPAAWMCRWCGYQGFPLQTTKISMAGIITCVVLGVVFFPLFWIGLLMKENVCMCPACRRQ